MCDAGCESGTCQICGKQNVLLNRKYYYYGIKCECHSPEHFEAVWHCKDCIPSEPICTQVHLETKSIRKRESFKEDLTSLINSWAMENESNTPDYILAEYLKNCLWAFEIVQKERDKWYGFNPWKNLRLEGENDERH